MCDGQAVGRTVGRVPCHARRAVSRRYRFGASPVPLVGPDGERRSVCCGSLLYCRTALLPPPLPPPPLLYRAVLQSYGGTPTSSPRRNFAALTAPGEGGAEGGGNGVPLSLPNSCDVCRAANEQRLSPRSRCASRAREGRVFKTRTFNKELQN